MNTSRETQVKRQRMFTGFHRIGVVIVPEEEEYRRRIEKVEREENISFPSSWFREGKGSLISLDTLNEQTGVND